MIIFSGVGLAWIAFPISLMSIATITGIFIFNTLGERTIAEFELKN